MNRARRRGFVVLLLAVVAAAAYGVYQWHNAGPSPELQNRRIISSATKSNQVIGDQAMSAPIAKPAAKSVLQLHAAFREAQRCLDERTTIRGNLAYNLNAALPPHIAGCDDLKSALRQLYEATTTAAKAGDVDAQMCYLMQGASDRETGFMLSEADIAEYLSLGPQYVESAFKRGDWRVIELLGFHVVDWAGLFTNLEQWKDPSREYKAHQLLLLGAGDVDTLNTDDWLAVLHMTESKDKWRLSVQEMQESDLWAQETYDKYFISQPRLLKEPRVCTANDAN